MCVCVCRVQPPLFVGSWMLHVACCRWFGVSEGSGSSRGLLLLHVSCPLTSNLPVVKKGVRGGRLKCQSVFTVFTKPLQVHVSQGARKQSLGCRCVPWLLSLGTQPRAWQSTAPCQSSFYTFCHRRLPKDSAPGRQVAKWHRTLGPGVRIRWPKTIFKSASGVNHGETSCT